MEPRVGTKSWCKNCDKDIVFEPYYKDGKPGPNPPVWFHLPGYFNCWVPGVDDKRKKGEPVRKAEPIEPPE